MSDRGVVAHGHSPPPRGGPTPGSDEIRLRGSSANVVDAGSEDDVVHAVIRTRAIIRSGPGRDTVYYARTRPRTTGCETVVTRYR